MVYHIGRGFESRRRFEPTAPTIIFETTQAFIFSKFLFDSERQQASPTNCFSSLISSFQNALYFYNPFADINMDNYPNSLKRKLALGGSIFVFVAGFIFVLLFSSMHKIQEGTVGIYYVQGALSDHYTLPGVHWQRPFVTEMKEIKIRPQTETLKDVKTVTKDGIAITFHGIQVLSSVDVSQLLMLVKKFGLEFRRVLINDRVAEDLKLFCANHTVDEVGISYILSDSILENNISMYIFRYTIVIFWILLGMSKKM